MANYPATIPQHTGSSEEWVDPVIVSYSRAGGAKARRLQAAKTRNFIVEHRRLTLAQKDILETFYNANRSVTLTFAWNDSPAVTYTVIFAEPTLSWQREGPYWSTKVRLAEVI